MSTFTFLMILWGLLIIFGFIYGIHLYHSYRDYDPNKAEYKVLVRGKRYWKEAEHEANERCLRKWSRAATRLDIDDEIDRKFSTAQILCIEHWLDYTKKDANGFHCTAVKRYIEAEEKGEAQHIKKED